MASTKLFWRYVPYSHVFIILKITSPHNLFSCKGVSWTASPRLRSSRLFGEIQKSLFRWEKIYSKNYELLFLVLINNITLPIAPIQNAIGHTKTAMAKKTGSSPTAVLSKKFLNIAYIALCKKAWSYWSCHIRCGWTPCGIGSAATSISS